MTVIAFILLYAVALAFIIRFVAISTTKDKEE